MNSVISDSLYESLTLRRSQHYYALLILIYQPFACFEPISLLKTLDKNIESTKNLDLIASRTSHLSRMNCFVHALSLTNILKQHYARYEGSRMAFPAVGHAHLAARTLLMCMSHTRDPAKRGKAQEYIRDLLEILTGLAEIYTIAKEILVALESALQSWDSLLTSSGSFLHLGPTNPTNATIVASPGKAASPTSNEQPSIKTPELSRLSMQMYSATTTLNHHQPLQPITPTTSKSTLLPLESGLLHDSITTFSSSMSLMQSNMALSALSRPASPWHGWSDESVTTAPCPSRNVIAALTYNNQFHDEAIRSRTWDDALITPYPNSDHSVSRDPFLGSTTYDWFTNDTL